jgi:uncharacterized protein YutE (UPF0331/DUF86 family)
LESSPKKVLHQCLAQTIISDSEAEKLLFMIDDRNLTTHVYDEEAIIGISKDMHTYYQLMYDVVTRLQV